jgi:hypothetical protein
MTENLSACEAITRDWKWLLSLLYAPGAWYNYANFLWKSPGLKVPRRKDLVKAKAVCSIAIIAVLLLLPCSSSHSQCLWTIEVSFWGDAKGSAMVLIHCNDGSGIVSVSTNHGSYDNIPIDASGDEKSVTVSGSGSYGYITYSGIAKGVMKNGTYSGSWKVKLAGSDGEKRDFSGKWQGTGNYNDICKIDSCK